MSLLSSVFIATSLDGFIARAGGELDWLDAANATVSESEECGYHAFKESLDLLIQGRKTYEQVLSFSKWPYGNKSVIVLSSNKIKIPDDFAQTVPCSSESPKELYERLSNEGTKRQYIDGGITNSDSFLRDLSMISLLQSSL